MAELYFAQARERGEVNQAGVGHSLTFVQLDLFEGLHAAENFQAAVGDLRQAGVVILQREIRNVFRSRVARFAAVHAREAVETGAAANVTKSVIAEADRRKFAQRGHVRHMRERSVVNSGERNTE